MRAIRPVVVCAAVLLGSPARMGAQEQSTVLTLDAALREARAGNRGVRAAESRAAEAGDNVRAARAGRWPRLTAAEAWQRGNQPVFVFGSLLTARTFGASNFAIDALNHPDPLAAFHTTVGVEQVIADFGRTGSAVRAAVLQRDIAASGVDEAQAVLTVAVTQLYGRLLIAGAARRAAGAGVTAARSDLARVAARRDAGVATEADVLGLAVHLADLEQRLIEADGEAAVGRAELNRALGAPIDRQYDVTEPAVTAPDAAAPPLAVLLARAEDARPELRRAAQAAELADTLGRQARAGLLPQVVGQAVVDVAGTRLADRASSWVAGGELRWTFSAGGADLARARAAAEAGRRARIEREDARAAVQVEIVSAWQRFEAARARQAVGRTAVAEAKEGERIVRERFEAGLAGVTDLLRASSAVLDAERRRVASLVDALVSQAQLDQAVGGHADGRAARP